MAGLSVNCSHCDASLKMKDESKVGKKVVCPKCKQPFLVQLPDGADDAWEDAESDSPPLPRKARSPRSRAVRSSSSKPLLIGGAVLVVSGVLAIGFLVLKPILFGSKENLAGPVELVGESSVEVPATMPDQASPHPTLPEVNLETVVLAAPVDPDAGINLSDPVLAKAQEFVTAARGGSVIDTVKMLDRTALEERIKGPKGSAEYVSNLLELDKVLNNLMRRTLESMPLNGGYRHWKILGKTSWNGEPAVMLRYYCEPYPPYHWLTSGKVVDQLAPLVTFEELVESAGPLMKHRYCSAKKFSEELPVVPNMNAFLPPRAGFLLLCFNEQSQLVDLVNPMGQIALSRAAGALYLRDYSISFIRQEARPKSQSTRIWVSTFGEIPRSGDTMDDDGARVDEIMTFRAHGNYAPKWNKIDLQPDKQKVRAWRLQHIVWNLTSNSTDIATLVADFRRDYPNDPGVDMAIVSIVMMRDDLTIGPLACDVISDSTVRLYETWRDPFLLHVRWIAKTKGGKPAEADGVLKQLIATGFQTSSIHQEMVTRAAKSGDASKVLAALAATTTYWSPGGQAPEGEAIAEIADDWRLARERASQSSREPQQFGLAGGGPPESRGAVAPDQQDGAGMTPNRPPFGPRAVPGNPGAGRPGQNEGPGASSPARPPEPGRGPAAVPPVAQGATVTIEVHAKSRLDINSIAKKLAATRKTNGFRSSTSGDIRRIILNFDGDLEEVRKVIDFGTITKVDTEMRTFYVEAM